MAKILKIALLIVIFVFFSSAKVYKDDVFQLSWSIEKDILNITIEAKTLGWIGVGIDPSSKMKDANFIIGYVKDGTVYISDQFGTGFASHKEDISLGGTNDIISYSGFEKDGITTLNFAIKLISDDKYDKKLYVDKEYSILLATGNSDSLTSIHRAKTKIKITL